MHINEWSRTCSTEMGNTRTKNLGKKWRKDRRQRTSTLNGRLGGRPKANGSQHDITHQNSVFTQEIVFEESDYNSR